MGSRSHYLGAELRMHSFTVNCETFSNEEKVATVVPQKSVEVACCEAMLALSLRVISGIIPIESVSVAVFTAHPVASSN